MKLHKTTGAKKPETRFPIVGIGASAGGLHSLECFLEALPKDFDFAVVFIQHLSPAHKSLMPEILRSKWRDYEFIEIEEGLRMCAGRLYLCPPAIEVRVHEGTFRVSARTDEHIHFPIDEFLVSLAEDSAERAVAVIFSGAGTDGIRGIQAVRTEGGTVFVQDPSSAQFPDLPQAVIKTGQVDNVLSPPDIAREIVRLSQSGIVTESPDKLMQPEELEPFYILLRERTGHHFNHYKKSVVSRRIRRRMYLQGISSISEYLNVVANKPGETALLASDLMIGVTSFFRDRLAWKALHIGVIKRLVADDGNASIRVWTPACATGEESYSIAMMLRHELDFAGSRKELQVFATDVNDRALEKAREGRYPASVAADMPADYLSKFFTYTDDGRSLTVGKELRQYVIFAKQDIITDPPFSRLDLVICRNLLIYLEPDAQEKCITLFHYALGPGGYLFLGNAESPGRKSILFKSMGHKKCRVYEKIETEPSSRLPFTVPFAVERAVISGRQQPSLDQRYSIIQLSQEFLLEKYAPAAVTIDQNYNILYHNGPTKRYLSQPRGATTNNLLELLPENLRSRIRGAIHKVTKEETPVSVRASIEGDEGKKRRVGICVTKIKDSLFLIDFREKEGVPFEASPESSETACMEEPAVRQLEIELSVTRQELHSNIEQLRSLNEEQQSSNEELQAANEELETSREELQSLNEELTTVNAQLQSKIEEQEETNDDLNNFFGSTNIPTIFLDRKFRVKRYTAAITKLIKLIPSDVGRQIIDMSQELLGPDLIADAQAVLEHLVPVKKEIRINSSWYVRTALPYRTLEDRIEGVVVTYSDVTELKRAEENAVLAKEEWERTFASVPDLIAILDNKHQVLRVNEAMARRLGRRPEDCVGLHCYEAVHGLSAPPSFCPHVRTLKDGVEHIEEVHEERLGGDFLVSTTPLHDEQGLMIGSVHVAHDITERKRAESELERLAKQRQLALDAARMGWWHYDPLTKIATWDEGYKKIFGVTGYKSSNEEILARIHPEDLPGVWAKVEAALDPVNPQPYSAEYRINLPDGSMRWVEAHGIASFAGIRKNRQATSFVGTVADITERKRAEEEIETLLTAVQQERTRLSSLINSISDEVWFADRQGRFTIANPSALTAFGISSEDIVEVEKLAKSLEVFRPDGSPRPVEEAPPLRGLLGEVIRNQEEIIRTPATGDLKYREVSTTPVRDNKGDIIGSVSIVRDITERKKTEEILRQSEERYRTLFNTLMEGFCVIEVIFDADGRPVDYRFMEINPAFEAQTGLQNAQGRLMRELAPNHEPHWFEIYGKIALTGEPARFVNEARALNRWYDVYAYRVGKPEDRQVAIIFSDITEHKSAEMEREATVEFLRLVNESRNTRELVQAATAFFQERSGGADVGVRLRNEYDYPYYETHGFPVEFVRAESRLCTCDKDGQPILDSTGNATLDCMCGNVICGRFDPSKPFFTKRGNFWTNSTTELLSSTSEKDRQARTRNRCHGEGYESVALIGLSLGDQRLGLLQLNDRRKDRFTPESLALWERLADYLAVALAKFRTDEELRASEEQFRTLADSIPNLAWWANGEGYITWYNQRWYEYTGATLEEMKGWGWQSVHDPNVLPQVLERWKSSIATGEPFDMEFPIRGADGVFRTFLTRIRPLKDSAGLVVRWFGTNTDVSPLKKAEEVQGRLAAIVQSAEDAIVGKDLNGIIQSWNVSAENIFGYKAEEVIGKSVSMLVPPGHIDEVPEILARIKRGEHIESFETVRMRKDGKTIPVSLTFSAVKDASGRIIGASKIAHDITERKRAEAEIKRLNDDMLLRNEQLEFANKELESFIYSVSHDLRGPLRHISGFTDLLMKHMADTLDEKGKRYLSRVHDGSEKMSRLIDDLLNLSRISRQEIQRTEFNMSAVAEIIVTELREAYPDRSVDLDIKEGITAFADRGLIEVVLSNLLGNAWKFTAKTDHARIEFGTVVQTGKISYYVRDNGAGFDQQYAGKMFWPFHRLHSEDSFEGTGIGLAIVERIIRGHGGKVWAEGKEGKGATIYFSLI